MRASNLVTILHETRSSKETSPHRNAVPSDTAMREPVKSSIDAIEMMPVYAMARRVDTETGLRFSEVREEPIAAPTIGEESESAKPLSLQQRGNTSVNAPSIWAYICVLVLFLAFLQIILALSLSGAGGVLGRISPFVIYGSILLFLLDMIEAVRAESRYPSDETT